MSLRRKTLFNLAGSVIPTLLSFVTIPLYLRYIGPERYGILALVWILLGYFGVFDYGLSRAVANKMARLRVKELGQMGDMVWSAFWLSLVLGLIAGMFLYLVATPVIPLLWMGSAVMRQETVAALPWIAASIPAITLTGIAAGALEGQERFARVNALQSLGITLYHLIPLLSIMYIGPTLDVLLAATLCARIIWWALMFGVALNTVSAWSPRRPSLRWVRALANYGAWASVSGLVAPLLETLDRVLVGALLGSKSVAFYSVAFGLVDKVRILPYALQRSLFPMFSSQDPADARNQAGRSALQLISVMTVLAAPGMFLLGPFLNLWVGAEIARSAEPLAQIFLLGMWVSGPALIPLVLLQSTGRPDVVARLHAAELIPFAVLLWAVIEHWGLLGVAVAWTIRVACDGVFLYWRANMLGGWVSAAVPSLFLVVSAFGLAYGSEPELPESVGYALVFGFVALAWAWRISPELFLILSRRKAPISQAPT